MAEHINNLTPWASGGHRWNWGPKRIGEKILGSIGLAGAARIKTFEGESTGRITGLLKTTAATRALADAAMTVLEDAWGTLAASWSAEYPWEDDAGRTGSHLQVRQYEPIGLRLYGRSAANWICWQNYVVDVVELEGVL